MVTKAQALTASEFHYGTCTRTVGKRGGVTIRIETWRRNGATQTWVTRPDDFRVPIKFGLKTCSAIYPWNAAEFHTAEDCPLRVVGWNPDEDDNPGDVFPTNDAKSQEVTE